MLVHVHTMCVGNGVFLYTIHYLEQPVIVKLAMLVIYCSESSAAVV